MGIWAQQVKPGKILLRQYQRKRFSVFSLFNIPARVCSRVPVALFRISGGLHDSFFFRSVSMCPTGACSVRYNWCESKCVFLSGYAYGVVDA